MVSPFLFVTGKYPSSSAITAIGGAALALFPQKRIEDVKAKNEV